MTVKKEKNEMPMESFGGANDNCASYDYGDFKGQLESKKGNELDLNSTNTGFAFLHFAFKYNDVL